MFPISQQAQPLGAAQQGAGQLGGPSQLGATQKALPQQAQGAPWQATPAANAFESAVYRLKGAFQPGFSVAEAQAVGESIIARDCLITGLSASSGQVVTGPGGWFAYLQALKQAFPEFRWSRCVVRCVSRLHSRRQPHVPRGCGRVAPAGRRRVRRAPRAGVG